MSERITPELVLAAYRAGYFPMADPRGRIGWYSPDPRCILNFKDFRPPRSLRQTMARGVFEVRIDTAFADVITACAQRTEGTWISRRILTLYASLHRAGFAHSVECWADGRLVGGLYGVALGGAFFGESMFHRVTDASKVALVALFQRLRERRFELLDTQWSTPHLARFGAEEIPRGAYLQRLRRAVCLSRQFGG